MQLPWDRLGSSSRKRDEGELVPKLSFCRLKSKGQGKLQTTETQRGSDQQEVTQQVSGHMDSRGCGTVIVYFSHGHSHTSRDHH